MNTISEVTSIDEKIKKINDILIERYKWICSQNPASAKFMYENGVMMGFDGKTIESAMKHGTLAIGQLGLAETLQILIDTDHTTEEGINPVARIMQAKMKLDERKLAYNSKMTDEQYQKELSELKNGNVNGEKIPVLTIIIKPLDTASYENMVEALDEMQICSIGKYVIDKINPDDTKLLELKGVK